MIFALAAVVILLVIAQETILLRCMFGPPANPLLFFQEQTERPVGRPAVDFEPTDPESGSRRFEFPAQVNQAGVCEIHLPSTPKAPKVLLIESRLEIPEESSPNPTMLRRFGCLDANNPIFSRSLLSKCASIRIADNSPLLQPVVFHIRHRDQLAHLKQSRTRPHPNALLQKNLLWMSSCKPEPRLSPASDRAG